MWHTEQFYHHVFLCPLSPPDVPQNATAVFLLSGCFHHLVLIRFLERISASVPQSCQSARGHLEVKQKCGSRSVLSCLCSSAKEAVSWSSSGLGGGSLTFRNVVRVKLYAFDGFEKHGPPRVAAWLWAWPLASRRPTVIQRAIFRETRAFFIMQRRSGAAAKLRPPAGTPVTQPITSFC